LERKFVRTETHHQLKEDRFRAVTIHAAEATVHWSVEHKSKLIAAVVAVVVLIAAVSGTWYYFEQQDLKASVDLGKATRTLDTPIRPAGMPPQPDAPSFASSKERATEAQKQFQDVMAKYPHTRSSEFAAYFLGVTSATLGDNASAEKSFKDVASSHNGDLAALAKFSLAALYRNTNRNQDAIALYKQLIDKPTMTVGKSASEIELAETYKSANQPQEAKKIYEQIQKENPKSQIAQLATSKLQELK